LKLDQIHLSHISTDCLIRRILRNLWMIVATALIFSMCTSLYLHWIYTPRYQASMTYAVTGRRTSQLTNNNLTATKEVSAVLTQMLDSNIVYNNIRASSEELADFSGTIQGSRVGESNFIVVTSQADSPRDAYLSICALQDLFPTIAGYVSSNAVVQVIRNPSVSATPINPINTRAATSDAALIGAAIMTVLIAFYSATRETVQTRSGARGLLDAHILATVYRVRRKPTPRTLLWGSSAPLQVFSPTTSFTYTEQINTICAQMEHEAVHNGRKIFMVTGVGENEGKSTISGNIAAALTLMGKKVAVLDCDLRNPSLNRFYNKKYRSEVPLNKLLSQPLTGDNLLKCMVRHDQLGLYMLLSLTPDERCTELLTSSTMSQLLRQLRVFDFVILDTPPMGYFTDTEALLDNVDASMLVVRQDRTPAADINDACDLLRSAKSHFMGVILNDMTISLTEGNRSGHGPSYGYGYGYGYGHGNASDRKYS
jgi:capsular exopolysaccharide synthesis family protein